jgi:hypothetical protein
MKIKQIEKTEFLVLGLRDNYYQPKHCWNEPDFKITVQQMIERYPETVFKELIIGPSKKMLQWNLAQSLFQQILKTKPKLIEEYNKNKIVKSK